MAIQTECSSCGQLLSVADDHAGKRARCPSCGNIYTVSYPGPEAAGGGAHTVPMPTNLYGEPQPAPSEATGDLIWMQDDKGSMYGPASRSDLSRWFNEGRVGAGYKVRIGESGAWIDARNFGPTEIPQFTTGALGSTNPYAPLPQGMDGGAGSVDATGKRYPKPDRGVLVLLMGILSFVICCAFGVVAIVMGHSALKDIDAGLASPNDRTLVQIGFWLGLASVVLSSLGIIVSMIFIILANF